MTLGYPDDGESVALQRALKYETVVVVWSTLKKLVSGFKTSAMIASLEPAVHLDHVVLKRC